jgi:hypothetical protein
MRIDYCGCGLSTRLGASYSGSLCSPEVTSSSYIDRMVWELCPMGVIAPSRTLPAGCMVV